MITYHEFQKNRYEIIAGTFKSFLSSQIIADMLNLTDEEYYLLLQSYGAIPIKNNSSLDLYRCYFDSEDKIKTAIEKIEGIMVMQKLC